MREIWYNVVKHYTCADSRPAEGRTNSKANRVPPAEHSMSETCYNVRESNEQCGKNLAGRCVVLARKHLPGGFFP